jgi:hypothetical protein
MTVLSLPHLLAAAGAVAIGPVAVAAAAAAGTLAGTALAVRSIWTMRQSQVQEVRTQVERSMASYLDETLRGASWFDEDVLDAAYVDLRDHFSALSARQVESARAAATAAAGAADLDGEEAARRERELQGRLAEVAVLQSALRGVLTPAVGAAQ